MMKWLIGGFIAVALFLVGAVAFAQERQASCTPYEEGVEYLVKSHGENIVLVAVQNGYLLEFWGNEETGSWTLLYHTPKGLACPVAAGLGWQRKNGLPLQGKPS